MPLHGPDRTRTDPTEFRRKKVRADPCGSGRVRVRVRVVEFSYNHSATEPPQKSGREDECRGFSDAVGTAALIDDDTTNRRRPSDAAQILSICRPSAVRRTVRSGWCTAVEWWTDICSPGHTPPPRRTSGLSTRVVSASDCGLRGPRFE